MESGENFYQNLLKGVAPFRLLVLGDGREINTNGVAVIPAGGTVASDGNNRVSGNGASAAPNATITRR